MAHGLPWLRTLWNLPGRRWNEPLAPALAGRFLSTVPPGKSLESFFKTAQAYGIGVKQARVGCVDLKHSHNLQVENCVEF